MLHFGTGGYPHSTKGKGIKNALETIKQLGLDALELELVRQVRYKKEEYEEASKIAKTYGIKLTIHGPYYINLNSETPEKNQRSREMIEETARAASVVGAHSITFHPGIYRNLPAEEVLSIIASELEIAVKNIRKEHIEVQIRPELMGKPAQFGALEELILLSKKIPGVFPCIDIAHYHARLNGKMNTLKEFRTLLETLAKELGKQILSDLHIHISGIQYGPKGEIKHLNLKDSDLRYKDFLKALKEYNAGGVVICESPNLEEDACLLKECYYAL
ncbi:MAG: TIM barrel protein [bacterium]